ncbi:MAG: glycosyltransferase family 39 protein [Eubacteriales bacterium]
MKNKELYKEYIFRIMACVLVVLMSLFVYINVSNASWKFSDDHQFLTNTVKGRALWYVGGGGRFYPLGFIWQNFLIPFGNNAKAYILENNLFLILMALFLFLAVKEYVNKYTALFCVFLLLSLPAIGQIYLNVIFAESAILFYLAVFIYCFKKGYDGDIRKYYWIAGFIAVVAVYSKEAVFLFFLVFSVTILLFDNKNNSKRTKKFCYFLLINSILFLGIYYIRTRNQGTGNYAEEHNIGNDMLGIFKTYLTSNYVFAILMVILLVRIFWVLIKKDRSLIHADAMLFSASAYCMAYVLLRMYATYYITPAYVFICCALGIYINRILQKRNNIRKLIQDKFKEKVRLKYLVCVLEILMISIIMFQGICYFIDRYSQLTVDLQNVIEEREKTIDSTNLLVEFWEEGYDIYMYYPDSFTEYDKNIQDWYKWVLYIFTNIELYGEFTYGDFTIEILEDSMISNQEIDGKYLVLFHVHQNIDALYELYDTENNIDIWSGVVGITIDE